MIMVFLVWVIRPVTKTIIRGRWPLYTDTNTPVVGYGANTMVTDQSGIRTTEEPFIHMPNSQPEPSINSTACNVKIHEVVFCVKCNNL
jgi:hypothetical protein